MVMVGWGCLIIVSMIIMVRVSIIVVILVTGELTLSEDWMKQQTQLHIPPTTKAAPTPPTETTISQTTTHLPKSSPTTPYQYYPNAKD